MLTYICGWHPGCCSDEQQNLVCVQIFSNIVNLSGNHHATRDAVGLLSVDLGLFFQVAFYWPGAFFQFCDPGTFFVFNNIVDFPRLGATKGKTPTTRHRVTFFLLTRWLFSVLQQKERYGIISYPEVCHASGRGMAPNDEQQILLLAIYFSLCQFFQPLCN